MIISIFVVDKNTGKKLFRSTKPLPQSKINYYTIEAIDTIYESEGIIYRETYDYVYTTKENLLFVVQIEKGTSYLETLNLIRHIASESGNDFYDTIIMIDNSLIGNVGLEIDLMPIKTMESQDEEIYKTMIENKKKENIRREKEIRKTKRIEQYKMENTSNSIQEREKPIYTKKKNKAERSEKPVLVVIKEKLKLTIDKENNIKENNIAGEMSLVVSKPEFKNISLTLNNVKEKDVKYSPYLNKENLKKNILSFDKERGINKTIPLMKWSSKIHELPIELDYWTDEDDGRYLGIININIKKNLENLFLNINKMDLSYPEASGLIDDDLNYLWDIGSVKKGESFTAEIRYSNEENTFFPIEINYSSGEIISRISVCKICNGNEEIKEYEIRKQTEVTSFVVVN